MLVALVGFAVVVIWFLMRRIESLEAQHAALIARQIDGSDALLDRLSNKFLGTPPGRAASAPPAPFPAPADAPAPKPPGTTLPQSPVSIFDARKTATPHPAS